MRLYPQLLLWIRLRTKFPTQPSSKLGHLLCPPPAHLQGLQTDAWSGPRWRRGHCTDGPSCAAPGPLRPSGGGCWTSADLDTHSHSSGRSSSPASRLHSLPVVLDLDPCSLTSLPTTSEKNPSPVGRKSLFCFLTFIYSVWCRGCHCTQYRSEDNLWECVLSFHHGVSRITREFACLAETTLTQGAATQPFPTKNCQYNRNREEPRGLQSSAVYSLARPFTMSRAYWLRSSVTEASRLEIAEGTESTGCRFQVLVPVLSSPPLNASAWLAVW